MPKKDQRATITIKLKPSMQDYIRFIMRLEYEENEEPYYLATTSSYLGRLVIPFLEVLPENVTPLLPGTDRNIFTFMLVNFRNINVRNNTVYISEKNQIFIQNIIEHHFRVHFRVYADDKIRYNRDEGTAKGAIKNVALQFCLDMNIKFEDVTYDMIYKAYWRSRKKNRNLETCSNKSIMIGHLFYLI